MDIQELFDYANKRNCSDLHITPGTALAIRRYGDLTILDGKNNYIPTIEEAEEMILSLLDDKQKEKVLSGRDLDFGAMLKDGSRIRANIYHQRNHIAASIRLLEGTIPTVKELGLPKIVQDLSDLPKGLVLVTGPTGSGKSTTLASMLQHINKTARRHIITIEDNYPRLSSFCVIPSDAFAWGRTVCYETNYEWPKQLTDTIIPRTPDAYRQAEYLAQKALNNDVDAVWIVDHDQIIIMSHPLSK